MTEANKIPVEVAYALPDRQEIVMLEVLPGTTAREAAELSGIDRLFPKLDLSASELGIFGKVVKGDQRLRAGDRVEVYRSLIADPKEVRKRRAAEAHVAPNAWFSGSFDDRRPPREVTPGRRGRSHPVRGHCRGF